MTLDKLKRFIKVSGYFDCEPLPFPF
jgi:hypothetical protein